MPPSMENIIRDLVLRHYPETQGIYLFGSHGANEAWPDSDMDIALLLPHESAKRETAIAMSPCRIALERALGKPVDLLNARQVSTVMQKEILTGRLLCALDEPAVETFEMMTLSFYQKLNEERAGIVEDAMRSGRFHAV